MYTGGRATSWRHFPSLSRWNAMHSFISWSCKRDQLSCGRIYFPPFYHQENTGPLYWKRWVKVSLKFRNAAVVPTWPLDLLGKKLINLASFIENSISTGYLSTMTGGIWTNWTGDLPSFKAWLKLSNWPRMTPIWRSNICRSKPLSSYRCQYHKRWFRNKDNNNSWKALPWRSCRAHHTSLVQRSCRKSRAILILWFQLKMGFLHREAKPSGMDRLSMNLGVWKGTPNHYRSQLSSLPAFLLSTSHPAKPTI